MYFLIYSFNHDAGKAVCKGQGHESTRIKDLTRELFEECENEMGSIDCASLKERCRTEELK